MQDRIEGQFSQNSSPIGTELGSGRLRVRIVCGLSGHSSRLFISQSWVALTVRIV